MKLFGQIVKTVVNTALLPLAVVKDVVTLGGAASGETEVDMHASKRAIERLKDEACDE